MNPNITMDIINQFPDKEWDWNEISRNPNINVTTTFIDEYPDNNYDWDYICYDQSFPTQRKAYVNSKLSKLLLLSMRDEDYNRYEILDSENCMDMNIQNERIVRIISEYL